MQSFLAKSFGGLTREYLVRQLMFGTVLLVLILWMISNAPGGIAAKPGLLVLLLINTLLYPYSRFVYESVVEYIVGRNVFFWNVIFMLWVKACTMMLCWVFSIFVAPVGLLYLFWRNSRVTPS